MISIMMFAVFIVVLVILFMLLLFIDGMKLLVVWRNWVREDPLVHPHKWLRPDFVLPAPLLQCEPHLSPGSSGVLSDPSRIDEEFRKAWLPYFCRSGQREASLEDFDVEVEGCYLCCLRFLCLV